MVCAFEWLYIRLESFDNSFLFLVFNTIILPFATFSMLIELLFVLLSEISYVHIVNILKSLLGFHLT